MSISVTVSTADVTTAVSVNIIRRAPFDSISIQRYLIIGEVLNVLCQTSPFRGNLYVNKAFNIVTINGETALLILRDSERIADFKKYRGSDQNQK